MTNPTWPSRELPILEAIRGAEEAGEDPNDAARRAVPELSGDLYSETINSLHEAGYLDAAVRSAGNGKLMVHVRRLLPLGRQVVGQWPAAPAKGPVDDRMSRRLLFLDRLYDRVGDNTLLVVKYEDMAEELGAAQDDLQPTIVYLSERGLIEHDYAGVSIAQAGIDAVERSRLEPSRGTDDLPPSMSVYIGRVEGSQISVNSPNSVQTQHVNDADWIKAATAFVHEFRRNVDSLPLPETQRPQVLASLVASESLLDVAAPERSMLQPMVSSLREVVLGIASNTAFAGLVELATRLT